MTPERIKELRDDLQAHGDSMPFVEANECLDEIERLQASPTILQIVLEQRDRYREETDRMWDAITTLADHPDTSPWLAQELRAALEAK